ncbi:MAG: hypothetical protein R6V35_00470 [Candidatus Nanohaloarchaea archaeon]
MANYWRPVFTLSKDEGPEGGNFKRLDAFQVTDSEGEYSGVVRYEQREGPDQFLNRVEGFSEAEYVDPNKLQIEFPVEYEKIIGMNDQLRGSGLDRDTGISDINQDDSANSTYRVEFYDERGVREDMTRWNGTIPDQKEFQQVFNALEGKAMEYIFGDTNAEFNPQVFED